MAACGDNNSEQGLWQSRQVATDKAAVSQTRGVGQLVRQAMANALVEGGAEVSAVSCTAVHAAVLLASTEVACCCVCQLVVDLPCL